MANEMIEIPFGTYTIPEDMTAEIKDGKIVVVKKKESEYNALEFLKGQAIEMIASIEHDISQSVYDGIKGHSPEDERELERWKKALAWLEKQKEQKPKESTSQLTVQGKGVYKICPRCKERMVRDDSKVYTSMPPQYGYICPKCGTTEFDTVIYDSPEMEEQKPAQTSEEKEYIRTIKGIISDFIRDKQPEDVAFYQKIYDWLDGRHREQKPNIELIQRSWYMEGYNDRKFGNEPKWIIKTGEGGPKYEENPKYGQMLEVEKKPAEINEYEIIKKHITEDSLSSEVNKRLTECGWYVTEQKPAEWVLPEDFEEAVYKVANFISPFDNQEELRKTSHRFAEQLLSLAKKELSKPAEWSEEDENKLEQCIRIVSGWEGDYDIVKSPYSNFLKSLRPQSKQEWSEEDEYVINKVLNWVKIVKPTSRIFKKLPKEQFIERLKSLRPDSYKNCNSRWKPSEEQMKALNALNCHGGLSYVGQQNQLISLYNDLKKLM